jgi:UDP-N-acetylglucosamine diphosphorylase/glucosamine-1-phosphate N-acetyltransferase
MRPILAEEQLERFPDIVINQGSGESTTFLNAALPAWYYPSLLESMRGKQNVVVKENGILLAAHSAKGIDFTSNFHSQLEAFNELDVDDSSLTQAPLWLWDYLDLISSALDFDLQYWEQEKEFLSKPNTRVSITQEKQIYIHNTAQISDFVHLDASKGPIIIDEDSKIGPFTSLTGPLYIGKRCVIKPSTNLSQSVVGNVCNIGGEVKGSIIHPYSNKSHDGFLGDSIFGSWVNFGAGTNVSNLKNNYGNVRVTWNGNQYDTNRQFHGCIVGDHTKTGIGVRLNTGTLIGAFSNVFQADFPPKTLPSFSWGNEVYDLERAIATAEKVLSRRGKVLSPSQLKLFKALAEDPNAFASF